MSDRYTLLAGELDRRGADPSIEEVYDLAMRQRIRADWLQIDEEPWTPELPDPDAGIDLLDGAVVATSTWLTALVLTAAALAVVLALLALRRSR